MTVAKSTRAMPSPLAAGDNGLQLNLTALTRYREMSTGMWAMMGMLPRGMRRKKHRKPMMDLRRIWINKRIVLDSVKIGQYISDL